MELSMLPRPLPTDFLDDEAISIAAGGGNQALHRLTRRLEGEAEGAVVHGKHIVGPHLVCHVPRLLGRGMTVDVWVVTSDAENSQIDFPKLHERVTMRRIAPVKNPVLGRLYQKGAVATVMIVEGARSPVTHFNCSQPERSNSDFLAPLQLSDIRKTQIVDQVGIMVR